MIPFLHIGPLAIPTYGLMVALGMVAAYYVLRADLARRGLATKDSSVAETFIALPCMAGIIGAKIYSVLETPSDFFADPIGQLFSRYGLTFTGGLLGGLGVYVWLAWRRKFPLLTMLDASAPAVSLGYAFGRTGCLLSGDGDYGIPTSLPWGMSFPNGLVPTTERVHPTPIYEAVVAVAIAWFLWRLGASAARPGNHRAPEFSGAPSFAVFAKGGTSPGSVFGIYLLLSGVARFLVEFIRLNPRVLWGFTNAQIASVAMVIVGGWLWLRRREPL